MPTDYQGSLFGDELERSPAPSQKEYRRNRKQGQAPTDKEESSTSEQASEFFGIPPLILPTRWEHLQAKISTDVISLRTIIQPVPSALQVIRSIAEYLRTTGGCQLLVMRADTGSGKTTFLNTLPHYLADVNFNLETLDLQFVAEDEFGEQLNGLKLRSTGINLIVLEGREKPETIPDKYIQVVLANINRFARKRRLPMLFVVPTIEEAVARRWCDHGVQIGDLIPEQKLFDGSRWYSFPGVAQEKFVEITRETVRVLNSRNIEDFGISIDELKLWADKTPTIGRFIEMVATESTKRRTASSIATVGKREHLWLVYCAPEFRHFDHTYLIVDGLVHDNKLHASPSKLVPEEATTTTARSWRDKTQWARFVTTINYLDVRVINFSIISVVSCVLAYGEQQYLSSFKQATIGDYAVAMPPEMLQTGVKPTTPLLERRLQTQNARESLERSNLYNLLRDMPAETTKGFKEEQTRTLAQFLHMMKVVPIPHIHFCVAQGLNDLLKYTQFPGYERVEVEYPLVQGQTDPVPDITIYTTNDKIALELHFRQKQFTSSEMTQYALRKIQTYMRSIPHLNLQLSEAYPGARWPDVDDDS